MTEHPENTLLCDELDKTVPRRDGLFAPHGYLISQDQTFNTRCSLISSLKRLFKRKLSLTGGLIALLQNSMISKIYRSKFYGSVVFMLELAKGCTLPPKLIQQFWELWFLNPPNNIGQVHPAFIIWSPGNYLLMSTRYHSSWSLYSWEKLCTHTHILFIMSLSCLVWRKVCPHKISREGSFSANSLEEFV